MNKAIACMLLAAFIVGCTGCTSESEKIYVIHYDNAVTNNVPMKAFNDEVYVWENWTIGTNKVQSLDK